MLHLHLLPTFKQHNRIGFLAFIFRFLSIKYVTVLNELGFCFLRSVEEPGDLNGSIHWLQFESIGDRQTFQMKAKRFSIQLL